jgi:hypothetical protein
MNRSELRLFERVCLVLIGILAGGCGGRTPSFPDDAGSSTPPKDSMRIEDTERIGDAPLARDAPLVPDVGSPVEICPDDPQALHGTPCDGYPSGYPGLGERCVAPSGFGCCACVDTQECGYYYECAWAISAQCPAEPPTPQSDCVKPGHICHYCVNNFPVRFVCTSAAGYRQFRLQVDCP